MELQRALIIGRSELSRLLNLSLVVIPLVVTTIILKTTLLNDWPTQFSFWVEHQGWSLHINWYNVSPYFRDEIPLIYYLVIVFSVLAYIAALFEKKHKVYDQLGEMPILKVILGMLIIIACLLFFLLGVDRSFLVEDVSQLTDRKYLNFMFNSMIGLLFIEFLSIRLAAFLGFYTRFIIIQASRGRIT